MTNYRALSDKEIATLTVYGCSAENWKEVQVTEDFSTAFISNVHFSGHVCLGSYRKVFELAGGVKKHAGIYNCVLHNCIIENDVFIDEIHNYIANYIIQEGTYIENINLLVVDGLSTFGNGIKVPVLNEGGGREIPVFNELSAPLAYILTLYRYRPTVIRNLEEMIDKYAKALQSDKGTIGKNVRIVNCNSIKNVRIGDFAFLEGVSLLENGTINSNESAPAYLGSGVKCTDFILSSGVSISDSTLISRCFVGQGCIMGKQYSAMDSLFFSNCQGLHGEAVAIFAGPYTVSHHKSSLLIAGMFSFFNAGSGSNQSNHMYKLGPVHQGVCERGVKTGSDSYMLWPAKIGAFTLVKGSHSSHSDTSDLPFSYLIENAGESYLVPAVNLRNSGTIRDAQKWPKRDNRKDNRKLDPINFNLLSPYTIQKMIKGIEVLKNIQRNQGDKTEVYVYQNCKIQNSSLVKGIDLYTTAITKFLGNSVLNLLKDKEFITIADVRKELTPKSDKGSGEWIDLSGFIAPKNEIDRLLSSIENSQVNLENIQYQLNTIHTKYTDYEWTWAKQVLEERWGKEIEKVTREDILHLVESWKTSVVTLDQLIYQDAKKEFDLNSSIGYGVDGNEEQKNSDFESVRGSFESNAFVQEVLNHIKIKTESGDELIQKISKINT